MAISPPEEIISEIQQGRMVVLVDDEDRENEGDLVVAAQFATPDIINFMAVHGRGLICVALDRENADRLNLTAANSQNEADLSTPFTDSIDAKHGITTGISSQDRARTVQLTINPASKPDDFVRPGHLFPLVARPGGVLERAGHTEAAVDLSRLAGLAAGGVICEIMNEDGSMSRLDDLIPFAQKHGLKIGTIEDLITYRTRHDDIVEDVASTKLVTRYHGEFAARIFRNRAENIEHLALVKGEIDPEKPVLVRVHTLNIFEDMLGEENGRFGMLDSAMSMIDAEGVGVLLLIRDKHPTSLSDLALRREGHETPSSSRKGAGHTAPLKDYGVGAQIISRLGVKQMRVLTNSTRRPVTLKAFGLEIVDVVPIVTGGANERN